jgi:hypothetical protein
MTLRKRAPYSPDEADAEPGSASGESHPLRSLFVFFLCLAAALLLVGVLAARTAGFREIVSVNCRDWFEARPRIAASWIAFPYDLVLADIQIPGPDAGGGAGRGLAIRSVRVSWRPARGLLVVIDGARAQLVETGRDAYAPAELEKLGSITNAAGIVDWLTPLDSRIKLDIRGGALDVFNPEGALLRTVGCDLRVGPVDLAGQPARHYRLETGGGCVQAWLSLGGFLADLGTNGLAIAFDQAGPAPGGNEPEKGTQP